MLKQLQASGILSTEVGNGAAEGTFRRVDGTFGISAQDALGEAFRIPNQA